MLRCEVVQKDVINGIFSKIFIFQIFWLLRIEKVVRMRSVKLFTFLLLAYDLQDLPYTNWCRQHDCSSPTLFKLTFSWIL